MVTPLDANPFAHFDQKETKELIDWLLDNPLALMQVRKVRQWVTRQRLEWFRARQQLDRVTGNPDTSIHDAVNYNIEALFKSAEVDRPVQLIAPVWAIDKIARNAPRLRVLSIGPRSEIEIFSLLAYGFCLPNITAVDLFSYSPYVKVADMHSLPFADDTFDVILMGWVLAYSKDLSRAAKEATRVARHSAVIAVSADYSSPETVTDRFHREAPYLQSSAQLLKLWEGRTGPVYFRHDPDYPNTHLSMAVFEIDKAKAASA